MKRSVVACAATVFVSALLSISCQSGEAQKNSSASLSADSVLKTITEARTTVMFTEEKVSDEDAEKILRAGLAAQSGMNMQPWHFSAVSDKSVLEEIAAQMQMPAAAQPVRKAQIGDAPFAVIVSAAHNAPTDPFDCGLAVQNMSVAALSLGYGTKIIASPAMVLNGERKEHYKQVLGIPADYEFLAALLIGKSEGGPVTDATAGTTTRALFEEKVTFVK